MKKNWLMQISAYVVLSLAIPITASASEAKVTKAETGSICNSACVTKVDNVATCDPRCWDRSGQCVFVEDNGGLTPVTDRNRCGEHWNKASKKHAAKNRQTGTEKQRETDLLLREKINQAP